ncbi:MAG: TlpA family protein disulfide reductase [Alphaproteobacteria bacterium]|nr:TlpA family protein disulfide reductase [Alphaproteobacteria bacterium]
MREHKKWLIVLLIAVTTIAFMLDDQTHVNKEEDITDSSEQNSFAATAPDVTFYLLDGGKLPLRSLVGHKVLLHFWASWCVPCRAEFSGLLEQLQKEEAGTVLLAVSGDAKVEDAQRFLAPYKLKYPALFAGGQIKLAIDPEHKIIEGVFQTFKYPETIIIAPDLTMRQKIVGEYKPEGQTR